MPPSTKESRESRRKAAAILTAEGKSTREIARVMGINQTTVVKDLRHPEAQAELRALRDEFRTVVMNRASKGLIQGTLDVAKQAVRDGDAKSLELSTRAAVNLDKLTASAVGETQKVDVSGHVNVDVRALLAAAFGYGPSS